MATLKLRPRFFLPKFMALLANVNPFTAHPQKKAMSELNLHPESYLLKPKGPRPEPNAKLKAKLEQATKDLGLKLEPTPFARQEFAPVPYTPRSIQELLLEERLGYAPHHEPNVRMIKQAMLLQYALRIDRFSNSLRLLFKLQELPYHAPDVEAYLNRVLHHLGGQRLLNRKPGALQEQLQRLAMHDAPVMENKLQNNQMRPRPSGF